jgi:hypothetical protein
MSLTLTGSSIEEIWSIKGEEASLLGARGKVHASSSDSLAKTLMSARNNS